MGESGPLLTGERRYVVTVHGRSYLVGVSDTPEGTQARLDHQPVRLELYPSSEPLFVGRLDGERFRALARARRDAVDVVLAGEALSAEVADERKQLLGRLATGARAAAESEIIRAPMPGLVVEVPVSVGNTVSRGASVVVLQAMKMENELRTRAGGKVKEVWAEVGKTVEQGEILVVLE